MATLEQTLKSTDQLMRHVDGSLAPQVEATLTEAREAMKNAKRSSNAGRTPAERSSARPCCQLSRGVRN